MRKKILIFILACLLALVGICSAVIFRGSLYSTYTGGGTGALDKTLTESGDYIPDNKSIGIVLDYVDDSNIYLTSFTFDADGTDASEETYYTVIRPDDYVDGGVWKMFTKFRINASDGFLKVADKVASTDTMLFRMAKAYIENPVVEDFEEADAVPVASTVTRVQCITDTGTATLNIENGANDVLSSDIVCDSDGQTSCASGCDVNTINASYDDYSQYGYLDISISATSGTPTKVTLLVFGTRAE